MGFNWKLDASICNLCLECVVVCSSDALLYREGIVYDAGSCTYCEVCVDVCQVDAISTRIQ